MKIFFQRSLIFLIVLAGWLNSIETGRAWNAEGHMVSAQIAYYHLTPAVRARCDWLIGQSVYDTTSINSNFVTAACWADDIKSQTSAFSIWHYVDYPFSLDGTSTNSYVVPGTNVVWAINNCIAALQNPATSVSNQAINLRFLIHFMGDITQPLHCSDAVSANHPNGDGGGNSFSLNYSPANLHSLWDAGGTYLTSSVTRPFTSNSMATITNRAVDVAAAYPYSVGFTTLQNVTNWALEGWNLAQTVSYAGISEGDTPTPAYLTNAASTSKQRMAVAGQRMADLLNILLAPHTNVVLNTLDSGAGSLRDTIANSQFGDIVTFSNSLAGRTILLTNGAITLSNNITIDGAALTNAIILNGNGTDRIFVMGAGVTAALNALIITNGYGNNPPYGGGVINYDSAATLTVNNCTFVGNSSGIEGGGLYNIGTTIINQCTFSGNNTGPNGAGGIYNDGVMILNQSTVVGNTASVTNVAGGVATYFGTLAMTNTIIAGNTSGGSTNLQFSYGTYTGANNLTNGNAQLASLGNYGGPIPTMPPFGNSPAIDQGVPTTFSTDQRGYPRQSGSGVDIGAVEAQVVSSPFIIAGTNGARSVFQFTNHQTQINFTNRTGTSLTMFASTNASLPLNLWSNLGLVLEVPPGSGRFQFTDAQSTNYRGRFYRLRSP